jgi:hypothetical protein
MNEGQKLYLQSIIDARPAGVRQLFAHYGITAEPSPETVKTAYSVFGKPFIGDLVNAVIPNCNSAEGDLLQANAAQADQKKTLWENISGVLTGAAEVLTAWGTATGKGAVPTPTPVVIQQPQTEKNNTLLFLGLGLLAIIILAVIIIVKKR